MLDQTTSLAVCDGDRFGTRRAGRATPTAIDCSDTDLMLRLRQRDVAALEALYDRHSQAALGLACRIIRDRPSAEDVVQDAFLTIWRQPERFDPSRGTARGWLLAIVHHRSVDRCRRTANGRRQVELTAEIVDRHATDPCDLAAQADERDRVRAALDYLPVNQRRTIELAYLHGKTHAEIAELMNCPLGTVKGRIRIALAKLRGLIPPPDYAAA